jgi:hypothetical protein
MEYIKLMIGVGLIIAFLWMLRKNRERAGLMNALLRIDTVMIIITGAYLIIDAVHSFI